MLFKYHAKDAQGVDKEDVIEALNQDDAVRYLHEQGLVITSLEMVDYLEEKAPEEKQGVELAKNTKLLISIFDYKGLSILALIMAGMGALAWPIIFGPLGLFLAISAFRKKRASIALFAIIINIIVLILMVRNIVGYSNFYTNYFNSIFSSYYNKQIPKGKQIVLTEQLELLSSRTDQLPPFMTIEGQVKNITNNYLENVQVLVQWFDKNGNFLTSSSTFIEYNPILPGQTSPFKKITTYKPEMDKYSISFITIDGVTINFKDSRK